MLIKLFGYLLALILLLVLVFVAVVRFQPQWLVSAVNAVQSDVLVSADAMSVHFDPLELQVGALDLDMPADQKVTLANVSTQANFSAWWTDEPFWLVEVDRADVQLGAASDEETVVEEPADAKSTPLDFLSYLTFTKLRVGELLVEQAGVDAPLLRLQLNAGQEVVGNQGQEIALNATGEAAGTKFELAGTLIRNAKTLGFDLQGGANSQESSEMESKLTLVGELSGGKNPSILLTSGDVEVLLGADKHLLQQLAGRITVQEVGGSDGVELQQFVGQYQPPGWEAPLDVALNLVGGAPAGAWHVDGTAEFGQSKITLETLSTKTADSWHGQLGVDSKGLPPAIAVQPYVDADLFPLTLAAEVQVSAADLALSDLTFESPTNEFAGTVNIAFAAPIEASADLQAQRLYFPLVAASDTPAESNTEQAAAPAEEKKPKKAKTEPTPVFTDEAIDWSWLQAAKVDVALTAQALKLQDAAFTDFNVQLKSADGQLTLQPFAATIGNGGFSGAVELGLTNQDADSDAVAASVSLQVNDVELESFGFVPQEELEGGALEVDVQLQTDGRSAHDLAAALQGDILVIVDEARLMNDFIELAGSDLLMETLNKLNPFSKKDPTTELKCGLAHFSVEQGVLSTRKQLVMETSKMEIVGDGEIDLNKERLNITLSPIAKSGVGLNVGSLVKFLKLGGRLNDPKPAADAGGLLKSGVAIGAAISTGGLSVVADGVASRALNAGSACAAIRKMRAAGASPAETPAQG